jgi:hypothetical protein
MFICCGVSEAKPRARPWDYTTPSNPTSKGTGSSVTTTTILKNATNNVARVRN